MTEIQPYKRGKDLSKEGKEMELPEGMTCGDCVHFNRCSEIFGMISIDEVCYLHPSKFRKFTTHGEIQNEKRRQAKKAAWNGGKRWSTT